MAGLKAHFKQMRATFVAVKQLTVLYRLIRVLSLDVAAGAVVGAWFFANHYGVPLPWPVWCSLALAIWLIYTLDHLADAHRIGHTAHTYRHRFHQQYARWLWLGVALAGMAGMAMLWLLPAPTLRLGATVAAVAIVYFVANILLKKPFALFKELTGALIYSAGVLTGPLSLLPHWPKATYLYFGQLTLVALANLLIFAWYEAGSDAADGHDSLIQRIGQARARRCIGWVLGAAAASNVAGIVLLGKQAAPVQWLLLLMTLALATTFVFDAFFGRSERYRILGDAVFFFPAVYLVLIWAN